MGSWWSSSRDLAASVPDLTGKVALVTGANRGLGYATTLALAQREAKVYLSARTLLKAESAIAQILAEDPSVQGRLVPLEVDLSSVRAARKAGERVVELEGAEGGRLDILVCNAAQTGGPYAETAEGISTAIASNHLGHFALLLPLLPLVERTALLLSPSSSFLSPFSSSLSSSSGNDVKADVRVVMIASSAHSYAPKPVQFQTMDDFRRDGGAREGGLGVQMTRYGQTKLCNILMAKELQRRWAEKGVPGLALSLNPGGVDTAGARSFLGAWYYLFGWGFVSPSQAAKGVLFAAASPKVREDGWGGEYLTHRGTLGQLTKEAQDERLAEDLWGLSERVVQVVEMEGKV